MSHSTSEIDRIRCRPGMYIGDVHDGSGLLHLVWEVVANSLDEHLAGHCSSISVEIETNGAVVVEDDGRGIAVEKVDGVPFAEIALTTIHHTPTLDGHAPHEHVGVHGVGLVAVNAVSSWLQIDSFRHGRRYSQRYERGHPITSLDDVGPTQRAGTRIAFLPDPMIFPDTWINPGAIAARLRELSWMLPSLALSFVDRREHRFHEPRGLRGFLDRAGAPGGSTDAEIFTVSAKHGAIAVEAAMKWYLHPWSSVESFANIERTTDGGTHVRGLLEGLADGLRAAAQPHPVGRKRSQLRRAVQQGLQAVVCVRLHDPTFGEPTRSRLVTPEAERAVRAVVAPAFEAALSHNGELLERFLKVLSALGAAG